MKPTTEQLADALDTACSMLETVGKRGVVRKGITQLICANCGTDWDADDPGNPAAHHATCDIPDVFLVRDSWKREQERAKLAEEVNRD